MSKTGTARSLSRQIVNDLKEKIESGKLQAGDRIPASRRLARELGVARGTVVTAVEILTAEGLLEARVGSGTYVSQDAALYFGPVSFEDSKFIEPRRLLDPADVDKPVPNNIDFRPCRPSLEAFPASAWQRCVAASAAALPSPDYGDPRGYFPLREQIARHLRRSRGLVTLPENIIVTSGAVQAMHLVATLYLGPGRTAIVEDPGYPLARQVFELAGARIAAVAVDDCGLNTDELPTRAASVGLVHTTPSHQFPLGTRLSLGRRYALLTWAAKNGVLILEDDYDGEFRYDVPPLDPLAAMSAECVIYCGTFSKTMFPELRIGYAVAPTPVVEALANLRTIIQYGTSKLPQLALTQFMEQGHYERHVLRMRKIYSRKRNQVVQRLDACQHDYRITGLDSGLNCTIEFPDKLDAGRFVRRAATRRVQVHHIARYLQPDQPPRNSMVLGYSAPPSTDIEEGLNRIFNE